MSSTHSTAPSNAGVSIDLLVRGICCLRPGVAGLSENIRVRSVVDRFLEHARIFYFEGGGLAELYCSNADWMPRNFQRRVEVLFPIEDAGAKARLLDQILGTELKDDVKSRTVLASGERVRDVVDESVPRIRSQQVFMQIAREARVDEEAHERVGRPFVVRPMRHRPSTELIEAGSESQPEAKKVV